MTSLSNATAKLAGIKIAIERVLSENVSLDRSGNQVQLLTNFRPSDISHYFSQARAQLAILKAGQPDLYGDFQNIGDEPDLKMSPAPGSGAAEFHYSKVQIERLARDIEQLFEIQAASTPAPIEIAARFNRVFITHGRATDWREAQTFIEKDVELKTMELEQEASAGGTIIEKLERGSARCDSALIVMTGDDNDSEGQSRTRENVMHEIGYFHGRYGRERVILLHEDGCTIPTNLSGIVYVPFPKGAVRSTFHVVQRELKHMYRL